MPWFRQALPVDAAGYFYEQQWEAIAEAMRFYKIPIENVIVIYDDISLEPGFLRIRRKGSDGGHNGIKSIIELTAAMPFPASSSA